MIEEKDLGKKINNLNINKSLIIINNNDFNKSNDNSIPNLNEIKDSNININNLVNNITNPSNQITNSNIVLKISYSKDSQNLKDNKQSDPIILSGYGEKQTSNEKNLEDAIKSTTAKNEGDSVIIQKLYEEAQNKEKERLKKERRIKINLDDNLYYHYKIQSSLNEYYEIYNKNDELKNTIKKKIIFKKIFNIFLFKKNVI